MPLSLYVNIDARKLNSFSIAINEQPILYLRIMLQRRPHSRRGLRPLSVTLFQQVPIYVSRPARQLNITNSELSNLLLDFRFDVKSNLGEKHDTLIIDKWPTSI
jgi:hypothetical protein